MLKDLLTEQECQVHEQLAANPQIKGSILYTRVASMDGCSIMVGCAPIPIPASYAHEILEYRD